ncbi:hypothetical protein MRX96_013096 [Rhipicephalus microplus]
MLASIAEYLYSYGGGSGSQCNASEPHNCRREASPSSDNQVPAEVATTKGDTMPEELSSSLSKEKDRGFWGRTRLPVPMFSKNDFSLWSILKQCIGKLDE